MSRDLNSKAQNVRLERLDQRRAEDDDEALRLVMRSEDGRRVVTRLAHDFGWVGEAWDATSERQTSYNAGRQSAARTMMTWAERVAPGEYLAGIGEATKRAVDMALLAKAATIEKDNDDG